MTTPFNRGWDWVCSWPAVFLVAWAWLLAGAPDLDRHYQLGADHGYQLSLGQQILMGQRPFVDLFWHYGPLTAITSAAGLAVHRSLVPETLICAAGYAAALTIVFQIARRRAGLAPALVLVIVNAMLLARFYKWYYWLFPLWTLWLLHGLLPRRPAVRSLVALGVCAGMAFLYRIDLGLGSLGLALGGAVLMQVRRRSGPELLRGLAWIAAGFALPAGLWLAALAGYGGPTAVVDYFQSYWDSARGVAHAMGLPYPHLTFAMLQRPLEMETGIAVAFLLLPLVAVVGLAAMAGPLLIRPVSNTNRCLACIYLGALGFFPQATHRADFGHLRQVLPLFTLAVGLTIARFWRRGWQPDPHTLWPRRSAATLGLAISLAIVLAVRPLWFGDLYQSNQGLVQRVLGLADVDRPSTESDVAKVVQFIRDHTGPDDTIVQLGVACQIPVLAQRRCAGCFTCYAPGLMTGDDWQQRNLEILQRDRPALIVVQTGTLDNREENTFPRYLPKLWAHVEQNYPHVALATPAFVVRSGHIQSVRRPGF